MKKITLLLFLISFYSLSQERNEKSDSNDIFKKSLKQQKNEGTLSDNIEYFDSINNLYSNFKYRVAFDAPNHWKNDAGVSEHKIFRSYCADSAITFSINVNEINITIEEKKEMESMDIWEFYQNNKNKMDYPYRVILSKQINSEIKDYKVSKTFLKKQVAIRRSFNYLFRQLDFEYEYTSIIYQTTIDNLIFTFGLDVPTMFYNINAEYYENLFMNISFLANKEDLNTYINKK